MIRVGIVGSAGYTAGELIRLLLLHPGVHIQWAHSSSNAGRMLSAVHTDLVGESELRFSATMDDSIDVVFLCVEHGQASRVLTENPYLLSKKIIDLSNEHRLPLASHDFVYGLPELNRKTISRSSHIANPGCFATALQLAVLPLAHAGLLQHDLHASAITGSTGAGRSAEPSVHFSWRSNNMQVYKPFVHQHLPEVLQSIHQLQPSFQSDLHFIPHRGNFTRGILASLYTQCSESIESIHHLYDEFYKTHPFTKRVEANPDMKMVVNTNRALLHVSKHQDQVFIVCVLDNLLKGASGQAVQNMNILFGLEEQTALRLKSVAF